MPHTRVPCVGAIITDTRGRLLLIKRGHAPQAGRWSLPGGRIEPGESDQQALVREVAEETGLRVSPGPLVGSVERPGTDGTVLDIRDYAAMVTGGELSPGDDADDARWVSPAELSDLPLTSGLAQTLSGWGVLGPGLPAAAPAPPAPAPAAPAAAAPAAQPAAPALIAEATKRAGLVWLTIPGRERPCPAWHIWQATDSPQSGAAYVVTGPREQPLPGLSDAGTVTVTVASAHSGGRLVSWTAEVSLVDPASAEWDAVTARLAASRLNAVLAPGDDSLPRRWARSGSVFRLAPVPA